MELACPNCQKRLTIPDQYAGQLLKCPICAGMFTAPSLGGASPPPPPPPPVNPPAGDAGGFKFQEAPPSPPPLDGVPPLGDVPPVMEDMPPPPPPPPGEYRRVFTINANPRIIPWIPPVGLTLMFILSFFPVLGLGPIAAPNFWSLGFNLSMGLFLPYDLLILIFAWPLSIVSLLVGMKIIPLPPAAAGIANLRQLILGGLLLVGFLLLFFHWIYWVFQAAPATIWYKLMVRIHLVVLVAILLEWWLERRKLHNLPEPKIEIRW